MTDKSRGSLESEIAVAVTKFHKEQHGKGPTEVKAHIIGGDLILVRCRGALTPTEARLADSEAGQKLIRSARQELRSMNHTEIESVISIIIGCKVLRSYCDLDIASSQQIEVYESEINFID